MKESRREQNKTVPKAMLVLRRVPVMLDERDAGGRTALKLSRLNHHDYENEQTDYYIECIGRGGFRRRLR
jgi:hypothetical protein